MDRTFERALTTALASLLLLGSLLASPASAQTVDIVAVDFAYEAYDTILTAGETARWTNDGATTHTVTDSAGSFDRVLQPGDMFEVTAADPGEIRYFCRFHGAPGSGMAGFLTVIADGDTPPAPRPAPSVTFDALTTGADNIDSAVAWTSRIDDGAATEVLLGRMDEFADLLGAGATGLPFLLTQTDGLDQRVADELDRLGATTVHVVGGTGAVSEDVVTALEAQGLTVDRIAGATRVETATALASTFFGSDSGLAQGPEPTRPGALIARARGTESNPTAGFADSLGAAAAGALLDVPVLVTDGDGLAPAVDTWLQDAGVGHVAVIGGEAAVPQAVVDDLTAAGLTVERIAGSSRDATAVALADYARGLGGQPSATVIVDGFTPDAWAEGFGAAAIGSVVVLSNGDTVPDITQDHLATAEASVLTDFFGPTDVLCAPGVSDAACSLVQVVVTTGFIGPQVAFAVLEGTNETDPGSPMGNGIAALAPAPDGEGLCYAYQTFLVGPITGAHVHRGGAGEAGDVVIPLSTVGTEDGETNGCLLDVDPALVSEIFADPGAFYVNVHNADFPAGAVRDNLFAFDEFFVADLSGDQEVPGPGAPMAGGVSFLTFNESDDICHYTIAFVGGPATAEHIHTGGPGEAGDVLIALTVSPAGLPFHADCIEDTDPAAAEAFRGSPGQHYVNVHSADFPGGAVRGQANLQYAVPS